jgi:ElaB/YqjD/DUF883 family membrane-anchored ribosome-binding protein
MPTPNAPPTDGITAEAKATASGVGQMAADKIDEKRGAAAGGLDSAADTLRDKADALPGGEKVASAAHTAADALASTAEYIRENDLKGMMADVQSLVKKNPGPALLTAAALGFLVARTFSRD